MTTLNPALQRVTYPQRKPFVRSHTFVDGVGPPPFSFFDETQDHLAALFHAALGWAWSVDSDEFTTAWTSSTYLSRMRVIAATGGFLASPSASVANLGEHGIWTGLSGSSPWSYRAQSAPITLDGDFLLTAKVRVTARERLDEAANKGFLIGCGDPSVVTAYPAISCGADSPNWQIRYADSGADLPRLADSGVPALSGVWYRLQISRVAGAVRWLINGQLVRVSGQEGVFYPYRLQNGCKLLQASRMKPGPSGDGFSIDSFHLMAERFV
jgi:hypothetical protein